MLYPCKHGSNEQGEQTNDCTARTSANTAFLSTACCEIPKVAMFLGALVAEHGRFCQLRGVRAFGWKAFGVVMVRVGVV